MRGAERLEKTKGKVRVRVMHGCCAGAETMEYRRERDSWNSFMSNTIVLYDVENLSGFLIQSSSFIWLGLCVIRVGLQFYTLHGG